MKNLILILLIFMAGISAKAQDAKNNASNNGTPVPLPAAQSGPAIGVNAPALSIPTAPPVQVLAAPVLVTAAGINAPNVMPAVPAAPAPPPAPAPGTPPPALTFATTLNLPIVPILPPIPPIPPMPDIRLPIGSN